jgi:hypothetical protein
LVLEQGEGPFHAEAAALDEGIVGLALARGRPGLGEEAIEILFGYTNAVETHDMNKGLRFFNVRGPCERGRVEQNW